MEQDDFMEEAPAKYRRLTPGREVRLRYGYYVTCTGFTKDAAGQVAEVRCTYDPETRGGGSPDGRKVKGTIHWVCARSAAKAEVRLYDRLFRVPNPEAEAGSYDDYLNPASLEVITDARIEPNLRDLGTDTRLQFERQGYFRQDPVDSSPDGLVFNRIVTLRDSWARARG